MIKIIGPTGTQANHARRRKSAKQADSTSFSDMLCQQEPTAATPPVASVGGGGVFVPPPDQDSRAPRRSRLWARDILDELDQLRMGFLTGEISPQHLARLSQMLENIPQQDTDPEIAELVREIEIRVRVELAKLQ